ncbi:MAG: hypothetical protein EON59_09025 [Alphaproteobacteria bacterium]|nr:MAG: hypothetical protein EON59_09025 [Alphaproteobacteria bacterium]
MDHWIEHPSEPAELILAWQAPDSISDRTRWAVGSLRKTAEGAIFRYFDDEEICHLNGQRSSAELASYGYAGYPAFDIAKQPPAGFSDGVLDAFARRLPPSNRPDFSRFLEHYRFRGHRSISTMGLLALTEAKLPSDGFSLIDRYDPSTDCLEVVFEVAGHRHNAAARERLVVGQSLKLIRQPDNVFDTNAIQLEANGELIGYVNRLQTEAVGRWLDTRDVAAWLIRLNGKPDAPRAFAFLQVRPHATVLAA